MIANSNNVIHFELSLHDDDDFVLGATVPASVRRLSDGKFLMGAGTWQAAYTTINMVELTGNDGVKGRYFLDLAAQASTDIYMFRALFTFAGESKARVWEEQTDAEAFRLTAARAQILTDWFDGNRLDLLLDAIPTTAMRGTENALTDKAGFSLSTAGILAVWHQALAAVVTASTVGKLIKDNVDGTISSRMAEASINTSAGAVDNVTTVGTTTTNTDMVGTNNASTHDAAAVVTAMMANTTDGLTLTSIIEATIAVLFGVAVPSGDDVLFKKRDESTTKVTQTYGSTDGERTGSVVA